MRKQLYIDVDIEIMPIVHIVHIKLMMQSE